jgi:hypothetical protein
MSNLSVEGWAKVVAAATGTFTLLALLWKPAKAWAVYRWDCAVESTFHRQPKKYQRILREEVFAEEVRMLEETRSMAEANQDHLVAVDAALRAQGVALSELPKLAGKMEGLPEAISNLSTTLSAMSENIGHIKGRMEERDRREELEAWDGRERRRRFGSGPEGTDRRDHSAAISDPSSDSGNKG